MNEAPFIDPPSISHDLPTLHAAVTKVPPIMLRDIQDKTLLSGWGALTAAEADALRNVELAAPELFVAVRELLEGNPHAETIARYALAKAEGRQP